MTTSRTARLLEQMDATTRLEMGAKSAMGHHRVEVLWVNREPHPMLDFEDGTA